MICVACDLYDSSYREEAAAQRRLDLLTYMKLKVIRKIIDVMFKTHEFMARIIDRGSCHIHGSTILCL